MLYISKRTPAKFLKRICGRYSIHKYVSWNKCDALRDLVPFVLFLVRIFTHAHWSMRENANQNNSKYGHILRSDIVLKHLTVFLKGYNSQTLSLGIWQNFIYAYLSQRKQKTKVDWTFRDLLFVFRISPPDVFCKKVVLRNFAKFTGKHLCQSLFF